MPTRSTTNYVSHAMTEMEVKQANKTTMFLLGGSKRPKAAWIAVAQAQKDLEDAQRRNSIKRKAPEPIKSLNSKRSRKSALSQEEKEQKLKEQRARYNEKRRKARAELRKKKQDISRQGDAAEQRKASLPPGGKAAREETSSARLECAEQQSLQSDKPQLQDIIDLTHSGGDDICTEEELADLIVAQLDDVMDSEDDSQERNNCKGKDEVIARLENKTNALWPDEKAAFNGQILSSAAGSPEDLIDESSEESEEE